MKKFIEMCRKAWEKLMAAIRRQKMKHEKKDKLYAWYEVHTHHILANDDQADESYEVLKKAKELNLYEDIVSKKEPKEHKADWNNILKAASLIVGLSFNLFLCGCIFQYEKFAPIITRCFGFIKPMNIY